MNPFDIITHIDGVEIRNTKETEAIKGNVNLKDYDSLMVGEYVSTEFGDFCCMAKPNIYQPIDDRQWVFQQCTDETGEPLMDGRKVTIVN